MKLAVTRLVIEIYIWPKKYQLLRTSQISALLNKWIKQNEKVINVDITEKKWNNEIIIVTVSEIVKNEAVI